MLTYTALRTRNQIAKQPSSSGSSLERERKDSQRGRQRKKRAIPTLKSYVEKTLKAHIHTG
jgi:hypothetical protein